MPEVGNKGATYVDAYVCTEEDQKFENALKEKAAARAERELKQKDDGEEDKENAKEERKESLPEESLRMASWVEVENERLGSDVEKALNVEEERDDVEEQGLLEVEGRCLGEAEKEQTRSVEEELAMMEEKWREQCAINETLKQRLADEEERFRVRH